MTEVNYKLKRPICQDIYAEEAKLIPLAALRYNEGKPEYSLLSLKALEPCVKVLEFGAKKYDRHNWKKGMAMSKVLDSLLRHVRAMLEGEMLDPESGLSHIGHIQCNAMFLGYETMINDLEI